MPLSTGLLQHLQRLTGQNLKNHRLTAISGGDINDAYQLKTDRATWFIKLNRAELLSMFVAEAAGLNEIHHLKLIRVPKVVTHGKFQSQAFLILEFIELRPLRGVSAIRFGQQLARLHQIKQPYFGWPVDNNIGHTPQHNDRHSDWPLFWQQQRLDKQLQLAARNGYLGDLQRKGQELSNNVAKFFTTYQPQPTLLHGDLWGGNAASDLQANPVMYDPACYYGDRETDIAMTELFGGFEPSFYQAYQNECPLDNGYKTR